MEAEYELIKTQIRGFQTFVYIPHVDLTLDIQDYSICFSKYLVPVLYNFLLHLELPTLLFLLIIARMVVLKCHVRASSANWGCFIPRHSFISLHLNLVLRISLRFNSDAEHSAVHPRSPLRETLQPLMNPIT